MKVDVDAKLKQLQEQKDILRHSLGLTQSKKPYRNHYCVSVGTPMQETLDVMVSQGLMEPGAKINEGRAQFYHVTTLGAETVGTVLPSDD